MIKAGQYGTTPVLTCEREGNDHRMQPCGIRQGVFTGWKLTSPDGLEFGVFVGEAGTYYVPWHYMESVTCIPDSGLRGTTLNFVYEFRRVNGMSTRH